MSGRDAVIIWAIAAAFQFLMAVGLLMISYGDTFGLAQIAANGEKVLSTFIQHPGSSSQTTANQLQAVLVASNRAFDQLSTFLGWIGIAVLICVLVQTLTIAVIVRQARGPQAK